MPPFHATDTSNNQGPGVVNIGPELVALGASGWWHKATEGRTFKDRYLPACRAARINHGLRYGGAYHWLTPGATVSDQFHNFRDAVGALTVGESIQLDIEDPAGLSDAMVIEAIDTWEDAYPGRVFHYMGRYYMNGMVDRMKARYGHAFRWWLPWYTNTFPASKLPFMPAMWQWAGGAGGATLSVGKVDSNQYLDVPLLDEVSGNGGTVSNRALDYCRQESAVPTRDWSFKCLDMCRVAWGVPMSAGWPDAWTAWTKSTQHTDTPPSGAPVYWSLSSTSPTTGVRKNYGHVAIADEDPAFCWSIDIVRHGKIDRVPRDLIRSKWGGIYAGWTSDLMGVPLPLDPQEEDDLTPEQDARLAKVEKQVGELVTIMTDPTRYGTNTAIEWMVPLTYTGVQNLPMQVTKTLLAALPSDAKGGLTEDQITEAVKVALRQGTQ